MNILLNTLQYAFCLEKLCRVQSWSSFNLVCYILPFCVFLELSFKPDGFISWCLLWYRGAEQLYLALEVSVFQWYIRNLLCRLTSANTKTVDEF